MISLGFKRFFAALRMTGFYIVRVLRAIRDEPLRVALLFSAGFFGERTQFAHTLNQLMLKTNVCLSIFF